MACTRMKEEVKTNRQGEVHELLLSWDSEPELPQVSMREGWKSVKGGMQRMVSGLKVWWKTKRKGCAVKPDFATEPNIYHGATTAVK